MEGVGGGRGVRGGNKTLCFCMPDDFFFLLFMCVCTCVRVCVKNDLKKEEANNKNDLIVSRVLFYRVIVFPSET